MFDARELFFAKLLHFVIRLHELDLQSMTVLQVEHAHFIVLA